MGIRTEYTCDRCGRRPMLSRGYTVTKVMTRPAVAPTVLGRDVAMEPDVLFFCGVQCIVSYFAGKERDNDQA